MSLPFPKDTERYRSLRDLWKFEWILMTYLLHYIFNPISCKEDNHLSLKLQSSLKKDFLIKVIISQVLGRLFAPSQNIKKLSHQFWVCFELGIGILNVPRIIFLVVYEPILKLQGLVAVEFQGKNCFKKTASNFSEIDCGFR